MLPVGCSPVHQFFFIEHSVIMIRGVCTLCHIVPKSYFLQVSVLPGRPHRQLQGGRVCESRPNRHRIGTESAPRRHRIGTASAPRHALSKWWRRGAGRQPHRHRTGPPTAPTDCTPPIGTDMAPAWHRHGTSMAPTWHRHGTDMAPTWHRRGTGTAPARHRHGTSMAPAWHQHRQGAMVCRMGVSAWCQQGVPKWAAPIPAT
jgi:hypothetical protein